MTTNLLQFPETKAARQRLANHRAQDFNGQMEKEIAEIHRNVDAQMLEDFGTTDVGMIGRILMLRRFGSLFGFDGDGNVI